MNATTDETANQRPGTTHPRLARERALKVLFAADVRRVDARRLLDEVETHEKDLELLDELEPDREQVEGDEDLQLELTRRRRLPLDDYTRLLVDGVASRQRQIDDLLGSVADNWQVQRMPSVDRNLLRLGIYELAEQDTPHAVVIDEAVSLAVAFAGEKAQSFVNGVLEAVRKQVVAGEVDLTPPAPEPTPESSEQPGPAASEDRTSDADAVDGTAAVDPGAADAPAAGQPDEDAAVEPQDEDVSEPVLATGDLAEVDTAAQEAYDLALDLLEAEGPLDEYEDDQEPDDLDDDLRFEDVSFDDFDDLDDADLDPDEDSGDDADPADPGVHDADDDGPSDDDLRDAGDALW